VGSAHTPNQLIGELHVAVEVLGHLVSLINLSLDVVGLLGKDLLLRLIRLLIFLLLLILFLLLDHPVLELLLLPVHILLKHLHLLLPHVFLVL